MFRHTLSEPSFEKESKTIRSFGLRQAYPQSGVWSTEAHIVTHSHWNTVDGKNKSPLIGPFKGINEEIKETLLNCYIQCRVQKLRVWAFSRGPGGFRELREAGRNHFHLSWYLSVSVVTSYGQKSSWGDFFLPGTVCFTSHLFTEEMGGMAP